MSSILEELWYGNLAPDSQYSTISDERKKLMKYLANHYDNLHSTLTDKQKEMLKCFDECYAELTDINERDIFVYAFSLGARIAIEIMNFKIG